MKQNGFILIISLIFLVIISMLGIAMFSGVTMDEKMSGNLREKNRSLDAAQTTLNAVQGWLTIRSNIMMGNSVNIGVACTTSTTQPAICSNALTDPTQPDLWPFSATYQPPGMSVSALGGVNTYSANTKYHIRFLGYDDGNPLVGLYQITAAAYGGDSTAISVVRAVYRVEASSSPLDKP
jgi:type IV pilus assembly protein PilX